MVYLKYYMLRYKPVLTEQYDMDLIFILIGPYWALSGLLKM